VIVVPLSVKFTVPVVVGPPDTVAVYVTAWLMDDGFTDETRAVVVAI